MATDLLNGAVDATTLDGRSLDVHEIAEALLAARLDTVSLDVLERAAITNALERFGSNRTHAARSLGISVRTLQRKIKLWEIERRPTAGVEARRPFVECPESGDLSPWAPAVATTTCP